MKELVKEKRVGIVLVEIIMTSQYNLNPLLVKHGEKLSTLLKIPALKAASHNFALNWYTDERIPVIMYG
jgi:hypothetical protein